MELKTTKGKILLLLLLILAFPFLQHTFSFFESGKLHGAVSGVANPSFTWNKWWEGEYQKQKTAYLNDSTGCRADLVRLNNQLDFWLFKKFHAHSVVMGKDEHLFEQEYVNEYFGLDYSGEEKMQEAVLQLKKVQDTLERMGKTFVFLYAPSKAYYFADKLPARPRDAAPGAPTNYATFKKLSVAAGIKQIDYNGWFLSMKDTARDQLFTRLGIHWTIYGSLVAADSFIKYIEHARNLHMVNLQWTQVDHTEIPRITDDDLAVGLNLIYPMKPEHFSYPQYSYNHEGNKDMPRILYIGDSFLWVWLYDNLMQNISNEFEIWYYFMEAWNQNTTAGKEPAILVDNKDWHSKVMNSDVVTILYVPSSFGSFAEPRSSIAKLYHYFYPAQK